MYPVILIETPTYESREFSDGSYEIRQTGNGGVTFNVAKIEIAGDEIIVRGDQDEIHSIIADCADIEFDAVKDYLNENDLDVCVFMKCQIENDEQVWLAENA